MTEVVFHRGSKSTGAGLFCESSSTVCIFFGNKVSIISDRIGDFVRDKILTIAKSQNTI